jgi:hypothetical protein
VSAARLAALAERLAGPVGTAERPAWRLDGLDDRLDGLDERLDEPAERLDEPA